MWRPTKHSRKGGTTWIFNQTWETRCPFSSEIDGTGYFCERDWWENLYDTVPEHTH